MRTSLLLSVCVLACGCLAVASDPTPPTPPATVTVVEVPQPPLAKWNEFKSQPGRQLILGASGAARWIVVDDGCDLMAASDGKTATFSAPVAGRYRLLAVVGTEPVRIAVTVGAPVPPDPTPPKPPDPAPTPVNTLVGDLKTAFVADKGAVTDMQALSALYTLMVTETAKPEYATAADLNGRFVAARDVMLHSSLASVRRRAGAEVAAVIGTDPTAALTADLRTKVAAVYAKLAQAVTEASK